MDIFVRESDVVEVDVFAWEINGEIKASNSENDVPDGADAEIIKCIFRRPTYQDSNAILRTASITGDIAARPDLMAYQDAIIRTLLVSVTHKGNTTDMRQAKINTLHTSIARAAVAGALEKITI